MPIARPMNKMNHAEIRAKAQEIIDRFCIQELPVNPFDIAHQLNILLYPMPPDKKGGISGALIRSGHDFGILYATNIPNTGYKRFTVAHEIGHFVLDEHVDHLQLSDGSIHYSRPGSSGDKYEREADYFAACLLMPDPLFTQAMTANEDGISAITALADTCKTSLTATAIRYIEKTASIAAIVVSERDKILYTFFSNEMDRLEVERSSPNTLLPVTSLTYEINQNGDHLDEDSGDTSMQNWFESPFDTDGWEEVKRLGSYEKTLTVLTFQGDREEMLAEENMIDSWEPRFRK